MSGQAREVTGLKWPPHLSCLGADTLPPGRRAGATTASPGPKPLWTLFHLDSGWALPLPAEASFVPPPPDAEGVPSRRPPARALLWPTLDSVPASPARAGSHTRRPVFSRAQAIAFGRGHVSYASFHGRAREQGQRAEPGTQRSSVRPGPAPGGRLCWRPGDQVPARSGADGGWRASSAGVC